VAQAAPPPAARHDDDMAVQSELGSIDPKATDDTLKGLTPSFEKCQTDRLDDLEVLSGKVSFFIRVGQNGTPRYVYFEESNLGDRVAEKCLIDTIMGTQFPEVTGGEAEVRYHIELPQHSERAPDSWDADKMADAVSAATQCKSGSSTSAQVTAYIQADDSSKDKRGKAIAVGVALPEKDSEDAIDCIVKAVQNTKLPKPGSYFVKVSFTL
jgi:hypothetical protein